MAYRCLQECVKDLASIGDLKVIDLEIDPNLELGMIQRRAYRSGAPALLFTNLKGCRYPALANLYATKKRARYVLRHGYAALETLFQAKADPLSLLKVPLSLPYKALEAVGALAHALPIPISAKHAPVLKNRISKRDLPQLLSWPLDGGAFITLPIVYTQSPNRSWLAGIFQSNMGMYRCQLSGNDYLDDEAGLHYQLHRGIGIHHQQALDAQVPLLVQIAVGGPPALAFAAVMPLPEGMPEILFAGALGGRGVRIASWAGGLPVLAEADFVIIGEVRALEVKPEGPFGDHLGYYSLRHQFPLLKIREVWARKDAIWPFTTVGRPPQEDSVLGEIIHELTEPMLPAVLPGVKSVNAVDEAGVHPLALAVASERYQPYLPRSRPQEILTIAHSLLGFGQLSLAKYLMIVAGEDNPSLEASNSRAFFQHLLARVNFKRDLHFQTETTMDTLDYSGSGFQVGSKLVIAACGPPIRELPESIASETYGPFSRIAVVAPGILALSGPRYNAAVERGSDPLLCYLDEEIASDHRLRSFPLWVITEDAYFLKDAWANFLWVTFTRSDPALDVYGLGACTRAKHWGCTGPLVVDARIKPNHAPVLEEDPKLVEKIENIASFGQPLYGLF